VKVATALHYLLVSVGSMRMSVRAVGVDGKEIDAFDIPRRLPHSTAVGSEMRGGRGGTPRALAARRHSLRHGLTAASGAH